MSRRQKIEAFLAACFGALLFAAVAFLAGCSALPIVTPTPVVNVSCTWHVADGEAILDDNDCLIDRSSSEAAAHTVGNEVGPVEVSPQTDVSLPLP